MKGKTIILLTFSILALALITTADWESPSFAMSHIYVFTNETIVIPQDEWVNVTFQTHENIANKGILHTFDDARNETFTVTVDGLYEIVYEFDIIDDAPSPNEDVDSRAILNGVEIPGSVISQTSTKQKAEFALISFFFVQLVNGDEIVFQLISEGTTMTMEADSLFGEFPDSGEISIKRIDN